MRILVTCVIMCHMAMCSFLLAGELNIASDNSISRAPDRQKQDAIVLRSNDFHEGGYQWRMIKEGDAGVAGGRVSLVGYTSDAAMDAIVPGTVLNSLVYNKVYPEPYFGINNANDKDLIPDITEVGREFYTYWFRTEFELPADYSGKQVMLRLDGINYRAEIWLNGQQIGNMAGMFNHGFFDVTDNVNYDGPNALAVLVKPVDVLGGFDVKNDEPQAVGENRNGGDGTFGKNVTQLMSIGWDFTFSDGIRDRNTGIWKDITIFPVDSVELRNPFIKCDLVMPDMTSSRQDISVEVINHTSIFQSGVLRAVIDGMSVNIEKNVSLTPNEAKTVYLSPDEYESLTCLNPELWWPINKGPQNLYHLTLSFEQNGTVSDTEETRFAVRHVTSDRNTPDSSRQFYVNGKPIFLHGTNWIPEAMLRKTDERMYAEMRYTQQAGINFIRFWGGGIVESDYFYDLCDELGIMVSMEFWQSGDTVLPADYDLYRENFADTIKALRNHPSVVYYISANERGASSVVPVTDLVQSLDGTRGYQAGSEIEGIHDGSPYKYVNPMFYYDDSASDRGSRIYGLCPEYGTPCLPTLDCLEEMMDVSDIWPVNETVWDYHDGAGFHDMVAKYVPAMQQYGSIESAEELAWKGQMVGAVGYRSLWECWTYNRLNNGDRYSSGVWFWYHNSPTRQVCGRMWDWSLEPTAALYYSQDAHEPIHAQYDFIKNTVSVNNEFYTPFEGSVQIRVFNQDMSLKYEKQTTVSVGSDMVANDVIHAELPSDLSPVHFIRLDIFDSNGSYVADTFYWCSNSEYDGQKTYTGPLYSGFQDIEKLPNISLDSVVEMKNGKYKVTITNQSESLAFMVRVKLADSSDLKPVRPSFYSDNFFSLLPGEEKVVTIESYKYEPSAIVQISGWNVVETSTPINDMPPVTDGLVMCLDADAIAGVEDGVSIGSWVDISDSGNDASQMLSETQPVYDTYSEVLGKPVVCFDGIDDYLDLNDDMISLGSFTLFAVGRFDSNPNSGNHYMIGTQTIADDSLGLYLDGSSNPDRFGFKAGNSNELPSWSPVADINPHVFSITSDMAVCFDGNFLGSIVNDSQSSPVGLNLGSSLDNGSSQYFKGEIAEVIFYDRVLSSLELEQVGDYLANKYPVINTSYISFPFAQSPVSGAAGVLPKSVLMWKAGLNPDDRMHVDPAIKKHYLWMGSGEQNDLSLVASIDISDYSDPSADGFFDLSSLLDFGSTYYWMVEEGLDDGAGGVYPPGNSNNITGPVWSFTTATDILKISVQPRDMKAHESDNARFGIEYSALSEITDVKWYKDDVLLSAGGGININWSQAASILTITNADSDDEGEYYAIIDCSAGDSLKSSTARLTLNKLLARYRFEQNASDSVGVNDGSIVGGMDYVAGKTNAGGQMYAVDPNGENYILLSKDAYPKTGIGNGLNAFTYSCWVRLDPGEGGIILGVFNDGVKTGLRFSINSVENNISVYLRQNNGSSIYPTTTPLAADSLWHFVAATYDGTEMKIYVDGTLKAAATKTLTDFDEWQYPMTLVALDYHGSINNRFSGQVDDLKIYNYALSFEKIAQEYLAVEGGGWICDTDQPGLVCDFDNNCQVDFGDLEMFVCQWLDSNRIYSVK